MVVPYVNCVWLLVAVTATECCDDRVVGGVKGISIELEVVGVGLLVIVAGAVELTELDGGMTVGRLLGAEGLDDSEAGILVLEEVFEVLVAGAVPLEGDVAGEPEAEGDALDEEIAEEPVGVGISDVVAPVPLGIEVGGRTPEVPELEGRTDDGRDESESEVGMEIGRDEVGLVEMEIDVGAVGVSVGMLGTPVETILLIGDTALEMMLDKPPDVGMTVLDDAVPDEVMVADDGVPETLVLTPVLVPAEIVEDGEIPVGFSTELTPDSADDKTEEIPGSEPDWDLLSEVGILEEEDEAVGEGVMAVVIPTKIPLPLEATGVDVVIPELDVPGSDEGTLLGIGLDGRTPVPEGKMPVGDGRIPGTDGRVPLVDGRIPGKDGRTPVEAVLEV